MQLTDHSSKSNIIRMLIVENDDAYALLLDRMVRSEKNDKFIIERVIDLRSAAERITRNNIDIILLDLYLPDGNDLDMLDSVRAGVFNNIPIVVLTNLDDNNIGINALKKGAQDYLVKSHLNDELLVRSIHHAIERHALIRSLRQSTEALEESEKRFRRIAEHNIDAIVVVNYDGIVSFANPAAEDIFGLKSGNFFGREFDFPVQPGMEIEVEIKRKSGHVIIAEMRSARIEWHGQDANLVSLRDITERKQVEKFKEEVVSIVSHELRSPLTSIMNSLSLIADGEAGEIPEQAQKLIKIAYRNSDRMLRLTNDMLDVRKIESGFMEFDLQPHELMSLIEQSIEANRAYARQFGVEIALDDRLSGIKVNVDSDRLVQVMTNLLTNAAKFSPPEEKVKVSVSRYGKLIRIAVKDKGPGIPEEFHNRIFEKFTQAQLPGSRRAGSGLGLNIAKMIVERMNGTINFETKINEGTIFFFDLPEYNDTN